MLQNTNCGRGPASFGPGLAVAVVLATLGPTFRPIHAASPTINLDSDQSDYQTNGGIVSFEFNPAALRSLGWRFSGVGTLEDGTHRDVLRFPLNSSSAVRIKTNGDRASRKMDGAVLVKGALLLTRDRGTRFAIGQLTIGPSARGRWQVRSALDDRSPLLAALELPDILIDFVPTSRRLHLVGDLTVASSWAERINEPQLAGLSIGRMVLDAQVAPAARVTDSGLNDIAASSDTISEEGGVSFSPSTGPDVIVGELNGTESYGDNLNGISAFSVGTISCNKGDERLNWYANSNLHPVITQNMFRYKNGRFEQIGMSWVKHGFYAVSQSLCSPCTDVTDGTQLGVGCSDPYSAGLNGIRSNMSPRSTVNAHTGEFPYPWDGWEGPPDNTTIGRRLQVHDADLDPALNAGASYFVEGHYVTQDDAAAGNGNNNASYRPALVSKVNGEFELSLTGFTHPEWPGLYAWRTIDPDVMRLNIHVPDDGTFLVAGRATDLGGGMWHYEYAVQNLNSERAARSFAVPLEPGATVTNVGFHDVDYHSGEPFDGTDWSPEVGADSIVWSTTDFALDPNANALRWGTLYNFWFDASVPPNDSSAAIELFKPGVPATAQTPMIGPVLPPPECNNGVVDGTEECDPPDGVLCDSSCQRFDNDALRGGLLWDTWWAVADALEPSGEHPLYPPVGQQSGSQTYRCAECHGWDYKGADGAFASGVHFTGINGVLGAQRSPQEMFDLIKYDDVPGGHGFGDLGLSDQDIRDLVQFMLDFVIDTDDYIDASGAFTADPAQGQANYETLASPSCILCHGVEGNAFNMGGFEHPIWVGTTSVVNPQRFLHRVRFGVPGAPMPSWLGNSGTDEGAAQIGRYAQLNLPSVCSSNAECDDGLFCTGEEACQNETCVHGPGPCPASFCNEIAQACGVADPIRGGLLYDDWSAELDLAPPAGNHPLYPTTSGQTGSTTFRCEECHGWDYKGVDGAYGAGAHYTGIRGILGSTMTPSEMYDIVMTDSVENSHGFSNFGLLPQDGWDLVSFLQSFLIDTDLFIDSSGSFLGNELQGQNLYTTGGALPCSVCHGVDGTNINFGTPDQPEWIGTISVYNPWELLHKIRFGQPGTSMPSWLEAGETNQGAADLGRHAQIAFPVDCLGDADCDDDAFCTGVETCVDGFCKVGSDPCPGQVCDEDLDTCLTGLCEPPLAQGAGPRYLAVTPQPIDSPTPMQIVVTSPDWPCINKYVGGIYRCGGIGSLCLIDADCNRCSISGDPCVEDNDCVLPGESCVISGQTCIPGSVEPIDINNDGIVDGTLGMLVEDPADAVALTPGDWGASLLRCSKSLAICVDDLDCDRGVCMHVGCDQEECNHPCSVIDQDCVSFCNDATEHACDTNDDCGKCSESGRSCRSADDCFPSGQSCILGLVECISQTCVRDESCIPGQAYIAGQDIVPSNRVGVDGSTEVLETTFEIRADCGTPGAPQLSLPTAVSAWVWSDVDNNGFANFSDIQLMVLGFQGSFGLGSYTPSTLLSTDIVGESPCNPERVVNFSDIQAAVFAFLGQSYMDRLDVGACDGNHASCSISMQDCADGTACRNVLDCELPCLP